MKKRGRSPDGASFKEVTIFETLFLSTLKLVIAFPKVCKAERQFWSLSYAVKSFANACTFAF